MRRGKGLTVLIALAAAFVTLLTQPTLAYYSVLGEATNVITSGDIRCRIVEKMGNSEFPKEGVYIMPGRIISKKVSVQNTGNHPFWLRVRLINAVDSSTLSADVLELDINRTDWIHGKDGYYYYRRILKPGKETEKLFTQVKVAGSADNTYKGKTVKLTVCAYAVQSEHNTVKSPLKVVGWPAEG